MRRLSLGAAAIVAVVAIAQPQRGPEFEVASIRPAERPDGRIMQYFQSNPIDLSARTSGTRFTLRVTTLAGLIMDAYSVSDYQFTGLPDWANDSNVYEINAKAPGEQPPTPAQIRLMLQSMLADRFQLKLHHKTKNLTLYELAASKDGPKLELVPERTAESHDSWAIVPALIATYLDYPLVDKTGLTGFIPTKSEKWDSTVLREELKEARPANFPSGVPFRGLAPSIFREVERQLGLTLRKVNSPTDFLIVDHVERPSEN
jgi:hypothetical protein